MKEKDFVYLSIDQGFALVNRIDELKANPYFKDAIAEGFVQEVFTRAAEITVNSLDAKTNILQKLKKNGDKIKIAKSKFEYMTRLTGIDVFDEETMRQISTKTNEACSSIQSEKPSIGRKK